MRKKYILISVLIVAFLLGACDAKPLEQNVQHVFSGESEHWKLEHYEVNVDSKKYFIGNGKLRMKGQDEYAANHLTFTTYFTIQGEERPVHAGSVAGDSINIATFETGSIGSDEANDGKNALQFEDIERIYVEVQWEELGDPTFHVETIQLYEKNRK